MILRNYKEKIIITYKSVCHVVTSQTRTMVLMGILAGSVFVALLLQIIFGGTIVSKKQTASTIAAHEEIYSTKTENPFETISLVARAAYVVALKTGTVLYAKNENEKLPLASVTKLMTALLARENMPESVIITLTKDDLAAEGDSGLLMGEKWRLGDLLDATLIISSNDGAHAIAGFVGANGHPENFPDMNVARNHFTQMMNQKATALNLDQMQFYNESGLDLNDGKNSKPVLSGGYGSARNVADLITELWRKYPGTLEGTARKEENISSESKISHYFPNTDEIVGHIPGLIASKTGFTDLAGGNLAVIFDRGIGDPVVVVVLGSGYKERFDDVQKLVTAASEMDVSKSTPMK